MEPYEKPFRRPKEENQQNNQPVHAPEPPPAEQTVVIKTTKKPPVVQGPRKLWGRDGYLGKKVARKQEEDCSQHESLRSSGSSERSSNKEIEVKVRKMGKEHKGTKKLVNKPSLYCYVS